MSMSPLWKKQQQQQQQQHTWQGLVASDKN